MGTAARYYYLALVVKGNLQPYPLGFRGGTGHVIQPSRSSSRLKTSLHLPPPNPSHAQDQRTLRLT
jgi:hypothetical protein